MRFLPSESVIDDWFSQPYMHMDEKYEAVHGRDVLDLLPSFQDGFSTTSSVIPSLWRSQDALLIFKKDPQNCLTMFRERLAVTLGHSFSAPVAPARIAHHSQYGMGCASLVLDSNAVNHYEPSAVCPIYLELLRDGIIRIALLDLLIGNSDNSAAKHFLFSQARGFYSFDFGGGDGNDRCTLSFIDELAEGIGLTRQDAMERLCSLSQQVNTSPFLDEALLFMADYPKASLREGMARFVHKTQCHLEQMQKGEFDLMLGRKLTTIMFRPKAFAAA